MRIKRQGFQHLLGAGALTFFCDGLDEVSERRRDAVVQQIRAVAGVSEETQMIVSSRPSPDTNALNRFQAFETCPLNRAETLSLVARAPMLDAVKENFRVDLEGGEIEHAKSFLANPLLLTILLLTYQADASAPSKMSQAFNERSKPCFSSTMPERPGYRRAKACRLDITDFERVMAWFSLLTLDAEMFSFSVRDATEKLKAVSDQTGLVFLPENVIEDCSLAVGLFAKEGTEMVFPHRTFQEYFAASFLCSHCPEKLRPTIFRKTFLRQGSRSIALDLAYEINAPLVIDTLVLPVLEELRPPGGGEVGTSIANYLATLKQVAGRLDYAPLEGVCRPLDDDGDERRGRLSLLRWLGRNVTELAWQPGDADLQLCDTLEPHLDPKRNRAVSKLQRDVLEAELTRGDAIVHLDTLDASNPISSILFESDWELSPERLMRVWRLPRIGARVA